MTKNMKTHLTKDQFLNIFNRIETKLHKSILTGGAFNDETKRKLGLNKVQTIPFNSITTNVKSEGSYWIDKHGRSFTYWKEGFAEHPYKNEKERIKVVNKLNKKIQLLRDKHEKEKKRKENDAHKELAKKRGIPLTELQKNSIIITTIKQTPPPHLIPLYDVYFYINRIKYDLYGLTLDNKAIFDICLENSNERYSVNETAIRWNKTVLEYYRAFTVDIYKAYQQPYLDWFEVEQKIVIDSNEYKDIPLLYDEQPEKEAGEDSEKFTGDWTSTKIELVKELRSEKEYGLHKTYAEAYRHAEKHITVNGEPVKAKNLSSLYRKTKATNKKM